MKTSDSSLAAGLLQQQSEILAWQKVLNQETFDKLVDKVYEENLQLTDDSTRYGIFRGEMISSFIANVVYSQEKRTLDYK